MTAEAPCSASGSPSPVTLFTPDLGDAATAWCPFARRLLTSLDPIRPVPPITTIFIVTSFTLAKAWKDRSLWVRSDRSERIRYWRNLREGKEHLRLASILTPCRTRQVAEYSAVAADVLTLCAAKILIDPFLFDNPSCGQREKRLLRRQGLD